MFKLYFDTVCVCALFVRFTLKVNSCLRALVDKII